MKPIEFDFVGPYNQLHYSSHTISYVTADVFVMEMFVSNERSCLVKYQLTFIVFSWAAATHSLYEETRKTLGRLCQLHINWDERHLLSSQTKCCNYNFQFSSELRAIKRLEIQWEVVAGGSLPANDSSLVYQQNFIFRTLQVKADKKILKNLKLTSQLISKPRLSFFSPLLRL